MDSTPPAKKSTSSATGSAGSGKVYTRTGDTGTTSLIGGTRISKSHLRLDAYGTIDELNSWLGLIASEIETEADGRDEIWQKDSAALSAGLTDIQIHLFNLGSRLACEDASLRTQLPSVGPDDVARLEREMDRFSSDLTPLKNFVLPGGARSAAYAHIARTICRRAERICIALDESSEPGNGVEPDVVTYINRLSDYLFVLARHFNRMHGRNEPLWAPRKKNDPK